MESKSCSPTMASSSEFSFLAAAGGVLLLFSVVLDAPPVSAQSCYSAIFSFGDSLADTGNAIRLERDPSASLPFGQTYFKEATGRYSDGRLMIDFIAQGLGLPLVRPYLAGGGGEEFRHGANFAVSGATALGMGFFKEKGMNLRIAQYNLEAQIEWFKKLLPSIASVIDINDTISNALFLMGEIGGNDYNHPFFQRKAIEEVRTYVPKVIEAISSGVKALVSLGAKTMLLPGNFPIGCVPMYLAIHSSQKDEDYDSTRCIKRLNELSIYHNQLLKEELNRLQKAYPHATIVYADYYEASMSIIRMPKIFGFQETMHACCGGEGNYGMNWSARCGSEKAIVCSDTSTYMSWDGLHMTEAAYGIFAQSFLEGPHAVPSLLQACSGFNDDI